MEKIKIGIITKYYDSNNFFKVENVQKRLNLKNGDKIHLGYTANFTQEYIIETYTTGNRNAKLQLQNVSNSDDAASILEKAFFIREEDLPEYENKFSSEDIGYKVIDNKTKKELGFITQIIRNPANDVWVMVSEGKEVPIPAVEEIMVKIDDKNKIVYVELIEGLMDLWD